MIWSYGNNNTNTSGIGKCWANTKLSASAHFYYCGHMRARLRACVPPPALGASVTEITWVYHNRQLRSCSNSRVWNTLTAAPRRWQPPLPRDIGATAPPVKCPHPSCGPNVPWLPRGQAKLPPTQVLTSSSEPGQSKWIRKPSQSPSCLEGIRWC